MYSKTFSCEIIIYPEFHKDQYSGYIKEQFNKWISDCFRAFTASFQLKVIQHGSICYSYNSETDTKDINIKKLWQNQYGTYTISISGEGIIMQGAKPIEPPMNIAETLVDKVTFKYKESSDLTSPVIIAYGKGIGLPIKYTRKNTEGEEWNNGFCGKDVYCPSWNVDISCTKTSFDKARNVLKEVAMINCGKITEIEADPYSLNIKVSTSYHLLNKNKVKYLSAINQLCDMVISDDGIEINNLSMDFVSSDADFSLESYFFDEISGKINVKNICI